MTFRARLIYNPTAGSFPSGLQSEKVATELARVGWEGDIVQSLNGPHITTLARDAADAGMDAVLIAGGDGSVSLTVAGLLNSNTALGVLPAGTSNVLAQELGMTNLSLIRSTKLIDSAKKLIRGKVYNVDMGYCNGVPFLLWAGIGLDGFIIHRIEPRQSWEKHFAVLQYTSRAVWNLHFWKGIKLEVHIDNRVIEGNYLMAVASNIRLYAGGLAELSPSAQLDDGQMDLWLFDGSSPLDAYQRAIDLFSGRHVNSIHATCLPFKKLSIRSEAPLYTQLDAEPYEGFGEIKLEVVPNQLRMLVPANIKPGLFCQSPIMNHLPQRI